MTKPMILRKAIRSLSINLMKLLIGKKANAQHLAFAGQGSSRELCSHIAGLGHHSVLVVTDGPLKALGIADLACESLSEFGVAVHWFDRVEPDPSYHVIDAGAVALAQAGATAVLAIGGGSAIDAAKIIAATRFSDDDPRDWAGFNKTPEEIAPLFVIPTTSGTGSEATMGAVITDPDNHRKQIMGSQPLLPKAVALDPALMTAMPPSVTAATGIDALTHGIEAYIGVWERGNRTETASLAVQGVFRWLRTAMAEPDNLEARMGMAMAAYWGGIAINQVNVGNVHAIAHQLGSQCGTPHGAANAVVLPEVLDCYGEIIQRQLAELAVATGVSQAADEAQRAADFRTAVRTLIADVGLSPTVKGLSPALYSAVIDAAIDEGDSYPTPRLLAAQEMRAILERLTPAD